MKVPKKNIHDTAGRPHNMSAPAPAHYPEAVIGPPSAAKGAAKSRQLAHKAMGRHPRGV